MREDTNRVHHKCDNGGEEPGNGPPHRLFELYWEEV
jgi:hypothetical protein